MFSSPRSPDLSWGRPSLQFMRVHGTDVKPTTHLQPAESKDIAVTGREYGPLGYEMTRISHFLDNRLTDGG
jgi:hypothetical protein